MKEQYIKILYDKQHNTGPKQLALGQTCNTLWHREQFKTCSFFPMERKVWLKL